MQSDLVLRSRSSKHEKSKQNRHSIAWLRLRLSINAPAGTKGVKVWGLTGPSLEVTAGVKLAGAEVAADANWVPTDLGSPTIVDGKVVIVLPHDSAALVFWDA
jgi:hypothetical protein